MIRNCNPPPVFVPENLMSGRLLKPNRSQLPGSTTSTLALRTNDFIEDRPSGIRDFPEPRFCNSGKKE
jgi:hypothetical protein